MILTKIINGIKNFLGNIYTQLFKIDDTAQRTAFGFGLGVFLGLLPGTGPIAALFCAIFLRVNRAATLLGALLTNTWISVVTFLLAVKIGSAIIGTDWQIISRELAFLVKSNWLNLFKLSVLKIILPVIIGYLIIGLFLGIMSYCITLIIITLVKKKNVRPV